MCSLLLAHGADPTLLNCHSKAAVDAAPTRELQDKLSCMYYNIHEKFNKGLQKIFIPTPRIVTGSSEGEGVSTAKILRECIKLNWKFQGAGGGRVETN